MQVELFFKCIKQHLRIKRFYGTSENAVRTQIWIAISVYLRSEERRVGKECRSLCDWSSDVCSSDLAIFQVYQTALAHQALLRHFRERCANANLDRHQRLSQIGRASCRERV